MFFYFVIICVSSVYVMLLPTSSVVLMKSLIIVALTLFCPVLMYAITKKTNMFIFASVMIMKRNRF